VEVASKVPTVKLRSGGDFWKELNSEVKAYLDQPGVRNWGYRALHRKATIIVVWATVSYILLVTAHSVLGVVLAGVSLALAFAAAAFNIMHDGGHRAFSRSKRVNSLASFTLEFLGGSSYTWDYKHNRAHHTYPNVDGLDEDIDQPPFARLASSQEWRTWHRWQHLYLWFVYGLVSVRWQLYGDIPVLLRGRISDYELTNFNKKELARFSLGKVIFVSWAFAIPLASHWSWHGALALLVTYLALGWFFSFVLIVTFQLAHCVDEAQFSSKDEADEAGKLPNTWAVQQVLSTTNFCPRNRVLTWFMGGLNYQLEHHLFSGIPHVHYPVVSKIVRRVCEKHGLKYMSKPTLRSALAGHYRHLRDMAQPPIGGEPVHA
jgi:linoleoyl-CoA desaturase